MSKDELIELLKKYKENQAKKDLRIRERNKLLKGIEKIKNDYESSITTTYQEGGKGNQVTSKVENKLIKKTVRTEESKKRIRELEEEIEELDEKLQEVNIRLGSLNRLEKEIITDYYINEMDYKTIGIETYWRIINQTRSERTVARKIEEVTEKMLKL